MNDRAGKQPWLYHAGDGPVIGVAVHAGHDIRDELLPYLAIDEATRYREEDPYTDHWTLACHHQIFTWRSRFEVDLNRFPAEAICVQPEDCWNLTVWKERLPVALSERSLAEHAAFYAMLEDVLRDIERQHGKFVVFDLHSYNHRREGQGAPAADPVANPDVNVGTGTMDRRIWAPVVDRFIAEAGQFDFGGRRLDVRENVNFRGRYLAQFVHETFPDTGCVLAIEVKKIFMDEWTGAVDPEKLGLIRALLSKAALDVTEELERL